MSDLLRMHRLGSNITLGYEARVFILVRSGSLICHGLYVLLFMYMVFRIGLGIGHVSMQLLAGSQKKGESIIMSP